MTPPGIPFLKDSVVPGSICKDMLFLEHAIFIYTVIGQINEQLGASRTAYPIVPPGNHPKLSSLFFPME